MSLFETVFHTSAAARAHAPGRVNLLGEHTDYNDGHVLPTVIPQESVVAVRPNGKHAFVVHAAALAQQATFTLDAPPGQHFARYVYGCIRLLADRGIEVPPLDMLVRSDVPIGVGLSSSAALEVATLRAVRELLCLPIDNVAIAVMAQRAEIDFAGVNCGIMDQMASSLGAPGSMLWLDTRTLERRLLPMPAGTELLVLDSGISRSLADTAYNTRRSECEAAAKQLGVPTLREVTSLEAIERLSGPLRRRARHVVTENARVLQALDVDAAGFGQLMNASHRSLRDDFEVSVAPLDLLVELLQSHPDVHGARLTGAGFGGACVALCRAGSAARTGHDVLAHYQAAGQHGRILVPPQTASDRASA